MMSLDNPEKVDAIGKLNDENTIILSIIDSWNWDNYKKHLHALQDKINGYFEFVESGQIYMDYPDAFGKNLRIEIISRYPIPNAGVDFLAKAAIVAAELDIAMTQRMH